MTDDTKEIILTVRNLFNDVNGRLDRIESRINGVETEIGTLKKSIEEERTRFNVFELKFDELRKDADVMKEDLGGINEEIGNGNEHLKSLETSTDSLKEDISLIKGKLCKLELTVEMDVVKNIESLTEGNQQGSERVVRIEGSENLKNDLEIDSGKAYVIKIVL
ncbi:MAG: hypothetical protein LUE88_07150 [Clostridiales bacterium]|nr:hypothetical protein [Clostridiales bacterium]